MSGWRNRLGELSWGNTLRSFATLPDRVGAGRMTVGVRRCWVVLGRLCGLNRTGLKTGHYMLNEFGARGRQGSVWRWDGLLGGDGMRSFAAHRMTDGARRCDGLGRRRRGLGVGWGWLYMRGGRRGAGLKPRRYI